MRSAGNLATLMAVEGDYAVLKLPSGEVRKVAKVCFATAGQVSNGDWRNVRWGKAGRKRLQGMEADCARKATNLVDHPHGGGEGSHPIGLKHPKTPQGKPAFWRKNQNQEKEIKLFNC